MALHDPETVLIFGDSNTWGFNPNRVNGEPLRFAYSQRWTTILQQKLDSKHPDKYRSIPEALNARTTVLPDPRSPIDGEYDCNGRTALMTLLHSHKPLRAVVISLGVNDLKNRFNQSHRDIVAGIRILMKDICRATDIGTWKDGRYQMPRILVIGLPTVTENHPVGLTMGFGAGADTKAKMVSADLSALLLNPSNQQQLHKDMLGHGFPLSEPSPLHLGFVDIGSNVPVSDVDGVHFSLESQVVVAEMVVEALEELLLRQ
jgi:lysophospholipase L1-like esterase